MEKTNRGRTQLEKYGITAEQYSLEISEGNLWCSRCKKFLPRDSFNKSQAEKRAGKYCQSCYGAYHRALHEKHREKNNKGARDYYARDPQRWRDYQKNLRENMSADERQADAFKRRLKSRFGLTPKQYEEKLAQQGGGCAICGSKQNGLRLPVDHKHSCCPGRKSCGKCIRGILCVKCNTIIGFLEMNRELVPLCEAYLISHQ